MIEDSRRGKEAAIAELTHRMKRFNFAKNSRTDHNSVPIEVNIIKQGRPRPKVNTHL